MRRILPYGERGLLVELADADEVGGYTAALRAHPPVGVVDVVPAARTVLVMFDDRTVTGAAMTELLRTIEPQPIDAPTAAVVTLEVRYDGEDLDAVARRSGIDTVEVVRRHTAVVYRSSFCGFAPGFAYLTGLDPVLVVPRLTTPRPQVRAGSVAIAAGYCGVYPRDMPGGWSILGRTDAPLWDLSRLPPALLGPGTVVRFRALD